VRLQGDHPRVVAPRAPWHVQKERSPEGPWAGGGLLLRSYGASRAFARRLRIDRRARSVQRARQTAKGAWETDITLGFYDCATVAIVEDDVHDRATSFDLAATRQDGEKVRLWPVTLRTRQEAEAALAALRDALAPGSRTQAG